MPACWARCRRFRMSNRKTGTTIIAVNVTANWQLIRTMDPLLQASPAGRAVFITSGLGYLGRAYWGPYAASKAALDALVRIYAAETATTNVRAICSIRARRAPRCIERLFPASIRNAADAGRSRQGDSAVVPADCTGVRQALRLSRPQAEVVSTSGLAESSFAPSVLALGAALVWIFLLAQRQAYGRAR